MRKEANNSHYPLLLLISLVLCWISLFGCSFNYDESMVADEISREVPDLVLYGLAQTRVEYGKPRYTVFAEKASSYGEKKELVLEDILFREYNEEGEVITEGEAEELTFFTESEDAELAGSVDFYSSREEAALRGDRFYWNDEARTLRGGDETEVELLREDGSSVRGRGFMVDFSNLSLKFSQYVSGVFVDEETEQEAEGKEGVETQGAGVNE
jgi:hypothetical protein